MNAGKVGEVAAYHLLSPFCTIRMSYVLFFGFLIMFVHTDVRMLLCIHCQQ
jgi:hypothetical protein